MNLFVSFFTAALTAAVLENAIFARGLGSSKDVFMLSSVRRTVWLGGFLTVYSLLAVLLAWPVFLLIRSVYHGSRLSLQNLYSVATLVCLFIVFACLFLITRAFFPKLHYQLLDLFDLVLYNCAALGAILTALRYGYDFTTTLGFALGSGIGYTATLLLVREGRRRIALAEVPRAFRGMPILLLYIGIFSLAIYGVVGHQLPT